MRRLKTIISVPGRPPMRRDCILDVSPSLMGNKTQEELLEAWRDAETDALIFEEDYPTEGA